MEYPDIPENEINKKGSRDLGIFLGGSILVLILGFVWLFIKFLGSLQRWAG